MKTWMQDVLTSLENAEKAALVFMASIQGSSPREAGAYMVVTPMGVQGTIGGGTLEYRAIDVARAGLNTDNTPLPTAESYALGPSMGQCCGGHVWLVTAVFAQADRTALQNLQDQLTSENCVLTWHLDKGLAQTLTGVSGAHLSPGTCVFDQDILKVTWHLGHDHIPVMLFGAGHVGRAIATALSPLPFDLMWIDSRRDEFPPHVPDHIRVMPSLSPAEEVTPKTAQNWMLVLTHSHTLDQEICRRALSYGPPPYLGLIGSKTKKATFLSRLRTEGVPEQRLSRLTCPIGLPGLKDKRPQAIAASVAADLMIRKETAQEMAQKMTTTQLPTEDFAR